MRLFRHHSTCLRVSLEALTRHGMRTSLSILGVVLGVAAVIAVMSVSEGARREILRQVELLGLDNVVVHRRGLPGADRVFQVESSGLTLGDVDRLRRQIPLVEAVSPVAVRYEQISGPVRTRPAVLLGTNAGYRDILSLDMGRGRFIVPRDDETAARVTVLGASLTQSLFGYRDPVGQLVRVGPTSFRVVGVLAERASGTNALGGIASRDLNHAMVVPLGALTGRAAGLDRWQMIDEVWLQVSDGSQVIQVGSIVRQTLARTRLGAIDFEVIVPRALLDQRNRTQQTFAVVVGSIAAISLLVGGIGIMNMMLVSVLERTPEIGLRRTVGATPRDVALQFLTESSIMALTGGTLGILLGIAASRLVTAYAGWSTHVSVTSVLLAFLTASLVGIVFGSYPALRAARLQPIDAVRFE